MSVEAEITNERRMVEKGAARARARIAKDIERGDAGATPAGVALVRRAVAPLASAIAAFVEGAHSGRAGRKHVAARILKGVDPELAAFITIRASLGAGARRLTLRALASTAADRLEAELLADQFEAGNGALYRAILRGARSRGLTPDRQAAAVMLANKHFCVAPRAWDRRERALVGLKLVELLIESLGIIQVVRLRLAKKRTVNQVQFTQGVEAWFREFNEARALTSPLYLPTVAVPKDWAGVSGGGYFSEESGLPPLSLITRPMPGQLAALAAADLTLVYKAINTLQRTPWRVNKRVLEVMRRAWESDMALPVLPRRYDEAIPPLPPEVDADVRGGDRRKAWRRMVRAIHDQNARGRSKRIDLMRLMNIASEYRDLPAIYFPYRLDFRGRCYATATSLTPQASDPAKGLLEFAEGVPLGERGLFWLGVHGSNLFGNDKVSLEDRNRWAHENWLRAAEVARDPLGNLWWTEADSPWCFLAWCFEWAEACFGDSSLFVSRLPIALDGSCNGIQHFSAMLRDPIGGAAVNLVPSDKPQDIYARVAARVTEKLREIAGSEDERAWMAQTWLGVGIDRKITKRPVMVLPYGGTLQSCLTYVREAVAEKLTLLGQDPLGAERLQAEQMLANVVWEAMGDIVVGARFAMTWLMSLASAAGSQPLRWTTPSGFVVVQAYREEGPERVETRFCGKTLKVRIGGPERDMPLRKSRQRSAFSPNVVHSLDAAALMRTVVAAAGHGISDFAMIHDSFGTHAGRAEEFSRVLRQEFVRMYTDFDVLENLRAEIAGSLPPGAARRIPSAPLKGDLDIQQVIDSKYFFA